MAKTAQKSSKIYLYDDRFTITFNTGDEEATISDKMLDDIENELWGEKLCLSSGVAHQKKALRKKCFFQ